MTFKLKKTELFKALTIVLCALAVAFTVLLLLPRGAASADEPGAETTYTVTWEYKISDDGEWQSFLNGKTLFTYEDDADYSGWVRAKIQNGDAAAQYIDSDELSFAVGEESVDALKNAAEYTVTIKAGGLDFIAAADKKITLKIAPRVFDLRASDFADIHSEGDTNRLWLLDDDENAMALGDRMTYFDPDAEYSSDYGANVTIGVLYNSYARYTGEEQSVVLNDNYRVNGKTLGDYMPAIKSIKYTNSPENTVGDQDAVNKITTTAVITLTDNWVLDNGENTITLTKDWYIVTSNNALRTLEGDAHTAVEGWAYGGEIPELSIRPEHGDVAVFTLAKDDETLMRFAIRYSGKGDETVLQYYDVKAEDDTYVIDTEKPLEDDYYLEQFGLLKMGAYALNVSVPAYTSTEDHEHWWDNAEPEATSIVYYPISLTYNFIVSRYELLAENISLNEDDDKDITIKLLNDHVEYNALDNNVPEVTVKFRGVELVYDVDYELTSTNVKVGKASFTLVGKGNFIGSVPFDDVYDIDRAVNSWKAVPSIMFWTYGNYDKQMNLINGTPTYLDNPNDISFKVTMDMDGEIPATDALASFLLTDGIVSNDVAKSLSALPVGTYYLFASVKGSTNYKPLIQRGVAFKVFPATNSWEIMPSIVVWTEGQFKSINMPVAKPLYGITNIVIKDSDGKDVYNNVTGVNKLSAAKAGTYTLTATVMGSNDYDGLVYSTVFSVHEKPGIPVWATVLIVLGSLLLVALIIFILIKTGVLRILTAKLMVNIRTQAAVDATVAAVRANKKNEEAKQYVAEFKQKEEAAAKKEERKKARRLRDAERRALPVEQKIAALEEKARKAEARAEKMRERAEAIQQRADRMRETAAPEPQPTPAPTEPATEPTAEAAATETPETTTEN